MIKTVLQKNKLLKIKCLGHETKKTKEHHKKLKTDRQSFNQTNLLLKQSHMTYVFMFFIKYIC